MSHFVHTTVTTPMGKLVAVVTSGDHVHVSTASSGDYRDIDSGAVSTITVNRAALSLDAHIRLSDGEVTSCQTRVSRPDFLDRRRVSDAMHDKAERMMQDAAASIVEQLTAEGAFETAGAGHHAEQVARVQAKIDKARQALADALAEMEALTD